MGKSIIKMENIRGDGNSLMKFRELGKISKGILYKDVMKIENYKIFDVHIHLVLLKLTLRNRYYKFQSLNSSVLATFNLYFIYNHEKIVKQAPILRRNVNRG